MLPGERDVAGLRCTQVLDALSDYVDGTLSEAALGQVVAHVGACRWCEQFGGRVTHVIQLLRTSLRDPEPLPPEVAVRLHARLRSDT